MKKEYMKPDMRVVKLKHRQKLLYDSAAGPDGYDGRNVPTRGDGQINDEKYVW